MIFCFFSPELSDGGKLGMTSLSHAVQGLTDAVDPVVEGEVINYIID